MDAMEGRLGNAERRLKMRCTQWLFVIRCPVDRLCMNPGFTLRFDGWTDKESAPLDFLYQHIGRAEHSIRYEWSEGALAFGTTGQRGTGRSTTIKAAAERCTESPLRVWNSAQRNSVRLVRI